MNKILTFIFLYQSISFAQIYPQKNIEYLSIKNKKTIALVDSSEYTLGNTDSNIFISFSQDSTPTACMPKEAKNRKLDIIEAQTFVMMNGMNVILIRNNKLPFVSYKIYFQSRKSLLGKTKGIDLIFNDLWGTSSKKYKKTELLNYFDISGTKLDVGENSIYLSGLSRYKNKNLQILSELSLELYPRKSDFDNSKIKLIDSIKNNADRNSYLSQKVGRKLMFGESPIGESLDVNMIDSLRYKDLISYYHSTINIDDAYLVVYGDITMKQLKKMVYKNFKKYKKREQISRYYSLPYNLHSTEIDFIENNKEGELVSVWFSNIENISHYNANWIHNTIGETLLFDDNIGLFYNQLEQNKTIENLNYKFSLDDKYYFLHYNVSADSIYKAIKKSIYLMKHVLKPDIDSTEFSMVLDNVRNKYISSLREPQAISDTYQMYYMSGLDTYMESNLMSVFDTLKYSDVASTLQGVLKPEQLRIVVSGQARSVPSLEGLGYKINYYDKHAKPTFPPSLDRPVPDSIDVKYVISNYIKALGGAKNIGKVKKMLQVWDVKFNGTRLSMKNKYMLPNRRKSTFSNTEISVLKTVFDGKQGYTESSGEIIPIAGDVLAKLTLEKSIFPTQYYMQDGYELSLVSQIPLKGEQCYKLKVKAPFGEVYMLYFRISDGLLIRKEILDKDTDKVVNYYKYYDFKIFEDIKFPYKVDTMFGSEKAELTMSRIIINDSSIKPSIFK